MLMIPSRAFITTPGVLVGIACFVGSFGPIASPVEAQRLNDSHLLWVDWPASTPTSLTDTAKAEHRSQGIEPALAGGLSVLIPGAGQFYNGQHIKGGLMLAGFGASIIYAATSVFGDKEVCAMGGPQPLCNTLPAWPDRRFWIGVGVAGGIYGWSVLDAIAVASHRTRGAAEGQRSKDIELAPQFQNGDLGLRAGLRVRH
jgi:hypothetical protein